MARRDDLQRVFAWPDDEVFGSASEGSLH